MTSTCARRLVVSLVFALAAGVHAFEPSETLVSPNRGLIDFEFSQARAMVVHTDPRGRLWLAGVDPQTGDFVPWHGRDVLLATGTVSKLNMFKWNGPEWVATASGDHLHFSYYRNGYPPTAENTRMALAAPDAEGNWVAKRLSSDGQPRMSHVTSRRPGDADPQIKYLDPELNHYWRNLLDPTSERRLDFLPRNNKAWRFASGVRALVYAANLDAGRQVFAYMVDEDRHVQLTFDDGPKDVGQSVPWVWPAPEFGNDLVLSTVVEYRELRIYRRTVTAGGAEWRLIRSVTLPDGRYLGSPEWFYYRDASYLSLAVFRAEDSFPSEVWVVNIDPERPLVRQVTAAEPFRVRNDPEVFITERGPYIYYNRYDPSVNPENPLCNACSEGVYRADTGLGLD